MPENKDAEIKNLMSRYFEQYKDGIREVGPIMYRSMPGSFKLNKREGDMDEEKLGEEKKAMEDAEVDLKNWPNAEQEGAPEAKEGLAEPAGPLNPGLEGDAQEPTKMEDAPSEKPAE